MLVLQTPGRCSGRAGSQGPLSLAAFALGDGASCLPFSSGSTTRASGFLSVCKAAVYCQDNRFSSCFS